MCGINVIVDKTCHLSSLNIEKMNHATSHRGPDFQKHIVYQHQDFQLFFGHNRLKIIDLDDRANQPMTDESKRYLLLFNGEIYNYYHLRNQLIDEGCKFNTTSDTEVLLQWLIHKGTEAISELEGMFAFAFFDTVSHELFCSRDSLGMKPFYYFEDHRYLIISSEIRGILASQLYHKELNQSQLFQYLNFRHARFPDTFFKNIFELCPGNRLIWKSKGEISINTCQLTTPQLHENQSDEALIDQCEEKVIEAVGNHLIADVPIGLFLSGGIDSTLLLAILNRHYNRQYHTFSIGYNQKEGSFGTKDPYYAPIAAKRYGGLHEQVMIGPEMLNNYHDYINKVDQPIGDSASLLTYYLSKLASKKVGVAWSGAGADELFGGYNRHDAFFQYLKNYNTITQNKKAINQLTRLLPTGFNHPLRQKFHHYKKFGKSLHQNPGVTYNHFTSFQLENKQATPLWDQQTNQSNFIDFNLKQAFAYDRTCYLPNDILALSDKMSMQNSLEIRVPFLSKPLISWVLGLPATSLMKNGRKWLLSSVLERYDGQQFVKRNKEGFGLPFGNWLRSGYANHLLDFLNGQNCVIFEHLDKGYVQKQLDNHLKERADNTLFLWSIIELGNWLKVNFD